MVRIQPQTVSWPTTSVTIHVPKPAREPAERLAWAFAAIDIRTRIEYRPDVLDRTETPVAVPRTIAPDADSAIEGDGFAIIANGDCRRLDVVAGTRFELTQATLWLARGITQTNDLELHGRANGMGRPTHNHAQGHRTQRTWEDGPDVRTRCPTARPLGVRSATRQVDMET